jgi:hypothetical protein
MSCCSGSLSEKLAMLQAQALSHLQEDDIPLLNAAALNRTLSIRGDFPAAKDPAFIDGEVRSAPLSASTPRPQFG